MKHFAASLLPGAALLAASTESFAAANGNARIAIHLMTTTTNAVPSPIDGAGKVTNCSAVEDVISGTPSHCGRGCFGNTSGYNPCAGGDPVQNTTWSGIKGSYSSN